MSSVTNSSIRVYGQTDRGLMREENEDSFLVDNKHQVYAVADGLGGLPQGSLASGMAIEELCKYINTVNPKGNLPYDDVFDVINLAVHQKGRSVSEDMGIGTTLTITQIHDGELKIGHAGDTGLVVFQAESWKQVTRDHTMAQDMIDRLRPGEQAYIPDYFSHTLTRCVGQLTSIQTDVYSHPLQEGDRVLIFSDGVTKTHELDEIHNRIFSAGDPETFVKSLIKTANERGGPDNITAIALFA